MVNGKMKPINLFLYGLLNIHVDHYVLIINSFVLNNQKKISRVSITVIWFIQFINLAWYK